MCSNSVTKKKEEKVSQTEEVVYICLLFFTCVKQSSGICADDTQLHTSISF